LSKQDNKHWPPTCSAALLHKRAELYQSIRLFFAEKGVLEVDTPILSQSASCDVNLDSFSTTFNQTSYYLQTSPEFAMKRLLAAGAGSIFQIAKSFRQGESGRYHNPEFTLLEWYRVEFNMAELIEEVVELLMNCFNENLSFSSVSYERLFHRYTNINPHETTIEELVAYATSEGNPEMANVCGDSLSNCLDFVFSQYIQPKLKPNLVYVVTDYPASMAMLAKLNDKGRPTAKRFEVYFIS
jgi:lysyl-tRNA synthetase class 2